jgi:hypothetical protein
MPSSYPGIHFDERGVCSQCLQFTKKEPVGEDALLKILRSRSGSEYDCIVGISGGKDSCYVAYLAKEVYKLRVLAVCYDFPFLCDLARDNIDRVCKTFDINLITVKSKNNLEYHLMRNHLRSLAATGTSWGQCLFCHYGINAILLQISEQKRIPFILSGITKYELWDPGSRIGMLLKRIKKLPFRDIMRFAYYQSRAYMRLVDQRRQFRIPSCSMLNVYTRAEMPPSSTEHIHIFDYVRWDQNLMEKVLIEKAGWAKPEKSISWRYDCILEPLLDHTYMKEFGISTVGIYLSHLIRDGMISRDEALKIMHESENGEALDERLEFIFDYLNLPKSTKESFFAIQ